MITRQETAKLSCKVLAIMAIFTLLRILASFSWSLIRNSTWIAYILPSVFLGFIAYLLWWKSDAIAILIFPPRVESVEMISAKYQEVEKIIFSVLGIFVIVTTSPSILISVTEFIIDYSTRGHYEVNYAPPHALLFLSEVIKLGLGLGLFLGIDKLLKLWTQAREWGVNKQDSA